MPALASPPTPYIYQAMLPLLPLTAQSWATHASTPVPTMQPLTSNSATSFGHTNISKDAHSAYSSTTASGCAHLPANTCTQVMQKSSMTSYNCPMNSASPTTAPGRESRQVLMRG